MKENKTNPRQLIYASLSVALIAVFAQISFPVGNVNMTGQTLAIAFCAYTFNKKISVSATAAYIILGLCGAPVFSGFLGGMQVLFGLSGGFLVGFVFMSYFLSLGKTKISCVIFSAIGLILCYFSGTVGFALVTGRSFFEAVISVCLPYTVKDILSLILAKRLSNAIKRRINYI